MTEFRGNSELCRSPEIANTSRDKNIEILFDVVDVDVARVPQRIFMK